MVLGQVLHATLWASWASDQTPWPSSIQHRARHRTIQYGLLTMNGLVQSLQTLLLEEVIYNTFLRTALFLILMSLVIFRIESGRWGWVGWGKVVVGKWRQLYSNINYNNNKKNSFIEPWLVWLSGLITSLRTKGSLIPFPVCGTCLGCRPGPQ